MPDETFLLRYKTEVADARRGIADLRRDLVDLDKQIDKSIAKLSLLGKDTSSVATYRTALVGLAAGLKGMEPVATSSAAALTDVGKNTDGLTRAKSKTDSLDTSLQKLLTTGQQVGPMLAGMGGGPGGGAGGGTVGGFGGSTFGGTVRRAVTQKAVSGVFAAARQVVAAGGDAAEDSRAFGERTGKMAADFRASLQPIPVLEGKTQVDDELVRSQLKLIESTASSPEEAKQMREIFGGGKGAALLAHQTTGGKLGMTEATAQAIMPEALKFAHRTDMDIPTAAKMFSTMGLYAPIPNVEAAMQKAGRIEGHLNLGGLGTMRELGKPFFGLLAEMAGPDGRIPEPESVAAYYGLQTYKSKSPAIAATKIKQANRAMGDLTQKGSFGLKEGQGYGAQLKLIGTGLQGLGNEQKKSALRALGLGNETEIDAIISQVSLEKEIEAQINSPVVKQAGDDAMRRGQEYMDSQVGQNYQADAKVFTAEIERGMPTERVERLRKEARARRLTLPEESGHRTGTTASGFNEKMVEMMQPFSGVSGETEITDMYVYKMLKDRGQAVGYDFDANFPGVAAQYEEGQGGLTPNSMHVPFFLSDRRDLDSEEQRRAAFNKAGADIEAAQAIKDAAKDLKQAGQQLNQQGRAPGNAAAGPMRP